MSSQFKGRMGEFYAEFDEIVNKLSHKELLWLVCFVNGYHAGNLQCLTIICPDTVFQVLRAEAIYMTNDSKRQPNMNRKRKLKNAYTAQDYIESDASPEDALIEAIDSNVFLREFN